MFSVYLVVNTTNAKVYVGKAGPKYDRWATHLAAARNGSRYPVHCALRKYGVDAFRFEIFERFPSEAEAFTCERALIAILGTRDPARGYNLTDGGDGASGFKHPPRSAETLRRLRESHLGKRPSPEAIAKAVAKTRGQSRSPEVKRLMSERKTAGWRARASARRVEFDGRTMTLPEWSEVTGIAVHVLRQRWRRGCTPAEILNPTVHSPTKGQRPRADVDPSSGGKRAASVERTCRCGLRIRGPSYFHHVKRCEV